MTLDDLEELFQRPYTDADTGVPMPCRQRDVAALLILAELDPEPEVAIADFADYDNEAVALSADPVRVASAITWEHVVTLRRCGVSFRADDDPMAGDFTLRVRP